jgi:predicted metal-dependent HD superfamily phosphohydrolase
MESSADPAVVAVLRESPVGQNGNFSASEATRDYLREHWPPCRNGYGDDDEDISHSCQAWFDRLWNLHTQESRHYHTAVHLEEMIRYLFQVRGRLRADDEGAAGSAANGPIHVDETIITVLLYSTFFHDAIYDGKSSTNEEDSAALFRDFARDVALPSPIARAVVDFIIATKTHVASDSNEPDAVLGLFLDLDMAVLGKRKDAYMLYAGLIRKEYGFVDTKVYCEKRADVLAGFLLQPKIFSTQPFFDALEARARENLREEIGLLQQGRIPGNDDA